jgi:sensor domain CHASE-containing protein
MAITTFDTILTQTGKSVSAAGFKALAKKFAKRFIDIREEQARQYVNFHLLNMGDERLSKLGYSRADILRQGSVPTAF